MPNIDPTAYDKAVKNLWRKVAGFEEAEDAPRLDISHKVVELGKISSVFVLDA
jgi:hypothetical protein